MRAIGRLARAFPETRFVHVLHPNPNVAPVVRRNAASPTSRSSSRSTTSRSSASCGAARLILTDSGGIQEEAPTFGKPVLVLREKTERPEGVEAGLAAARGHGRGAHRRARLGTARRPRRPRAMTGRVNPYGDGLASERIAAILAGRPFTPFVPPA